MACWTYWRSGSLAGETTKPLVPVPPRVTFAIAIAPEGTNRLANAQTTPRPEATVTSTGPRRVLRAALQLTEVRRHRPPAVRGRRSVTR